MTLGYPVNEGMYNTPSVPYYHSPHPHTLCHDYVEVSDNMVSSTGNKYNHEVAAQSHLEHRANDYIMSNRPLPLPVESDGQLT